jgi:hypothetical protein
MLLRASFATVALATLWAVHADGFPIEVSVLIFLAAVSVGSVFIPHVGNAAVGAIVIFLATAIAFLVAQALSSIGIHPVVSRFEVLSILLIVAFVGVSSALLCTYTNYRVWQMLGSLGIFLVSLLLQFWGQEGRLQGLGLLMGILTAVPWLVGLGIGAGIRSGGTP